MNYDNLDSFKAMVAKRNINVMGALGDAPKGIKQQELYYTTRDGRKIRAKLYQPTEPPKEGCPLVVFFHGGGFCIGAPEGEEQTCRNFVQAFKAVCVSATYGLAPEHRFPTAINDGYAALKWSTENAQSWGANPSLGFIIGGTSAGGNISAVLAHRARDENFSPPLTGVHLVVPGVLPASAVPEQHKPYFLSYEQNRHAAVLPVAAMEMFTRGYKPDENDGVNYAVFNHPKGHAGLPPMVFQVDGMDPLRDEAIIFERVLRQDYGVKTRLYIYPGLPHGHFGFFPSLNDSAEFRKEQVEGMGWLLDKTPDFRDVVLNAQAAGV